MRYQKIIFVCTSNTSRSAMAERIFNSLETNSDIQVLSRGLVVLFPEPVNPKAAIVMENHNLPINDHNAVLLSAEDIEEETLILTMNQQQRDKVIEEYGMEINVFPLKEYVGESGEVWDPYGQTLVEYEECYVELARLIKKTVYKLNEEEGRSFD